MIKKLLNISILVAIIIFLSEFNIACGQSIDYRFPQNYMNGLNEQLQNERLKTQIYQENINRKMQEIRLNNEINRSRMSENARIAQENQIIYRNNTNTINTLNHGINSLANVVRQIKNLSK